MFGYIKINKPQMKICEFDTYKAAYCSLCKQLGKTYGLFSKMILSYDFTFLLLLRVGLQKECPGFKKMRCSFNPLKKCSRFKNHTEELDYTAAAAIILFYYKLKDNLQDNGFFKRIPFVVIYPYFARKKKKAARKYPWIDRLAGEMMEKQLVIEQKDCKNLDEAAHPTAEMLSFLLSRDGEDKETRIISRLGYCLGKWIYLCDAVDDLDNDSKNKMYNPLDTKNGIAAAKEEGKGLLNMCMTEAAACFELLEMKRYGTILANVIYEGMPTVLDNLSSTVNS